MSSNHTTYLQRNKLGFVKNTELRTTYFILRTVVNKNIKNWKVSTHVLLIFARPTTRFGGKAYSINLKK